MPDATPPAPANVVLSTGNQTVTLSWSRSPAQDLDHYRIYVDSTAPHDFADAFTITVNTTFIDPVVHAHTSWNETTSYYYRITAVDKGAPDFAGLALESPAADAGFAVPFGALPRAPQLILSSATATQFLWTLIDGATDEIGLHVSSTNAGQGAAASRRTSGPWRAPAGPPLFYVETGLAPNTLYTRFGEAFNFAGSSFSAPVSSHTLANPPVNTQVAAASSTAISLSWDDNGNPAGTIYEVHYATNATFMGTASTATAANNAVAVVGLAPATTYWLRVRARNGDDVPTPFDVTVSTVTPMPADAIAPAAPIGIWAEWLQLNPPTFRVHWRPVPNTTDGTPFDDPAAERYKVLAPRP